MNRSLGYRIRSWFFYLRWWWKMNVSGFQASELIDFKKYPEALRMDPFEFEEFKKRNPR